jgi:hypothetical protein
MQVSFEFENSHHETFSLKDLERLKAMTSIVFKVTSVLSIPSCLPLTVFVIPSPPPSIRYRIARMMQAPTQGN